MSSQPDGPIESDQLRIPPSIWILGFVTLLKNVSSVIVATFAPLFLREVVGISLQGIGLLEGCVEALSFFSRIIAGVISDSMRQRKSLIIIGYGLGMIARVFLTLSQTVWDIFSSRAFERLGNGIQASPRDALVADLSNASNRGACYGLRQSLTVMGSLVGAALGMAFMSFFPGNYRFLFALTLIPSAIAILLLVFGIHEPKNRDPQNKKPAQFQWGDIYRDIALLPKNYWPLIGLGFLFMMNNFSMSFMVLRGENLGLSLAWIPMIMIVQNLASAVSAFPAGWLADRLDRRHILMLGFGFLAAGNWLLSIASGTTVFFMGVLFWGLQIGVVQSNFMAFIAELTPPEVRGTGFGVFHFTSGLGVLLGNILMGLGCGYFSFSYAFLASSLLVVVTLMLIPVCIPKKRQVSAMAL